MTSTQTIQEMLPAGYDVRERRRPSGVMGWTPQWIITGRWGEEATVTSEAQVPAAIERIDAAHTASMARATAQLAAPIAPAAAPAAPTATTRRTGYDYYGRRCTDHETDNRGICYSCGTYVAGDDAGRTIRRYGMAR